MRLLTCCLVLLSATAHAQQSPDLAAQREAMKKLSFLAGTWTGDANVLSSPGGPIKVKQTEVVQYKLDGLILQVEGTGRNPDTGAVVFQAFATIAYDDAAKIYRFRSYNDGRYLDTELKAPPNGFEWGFEAGPATVRFVMRLNEKGEWVENGTVKIRDGPPRPTIELLVRRQK